VGKGGGHDIGSCWVGAAREVAKMGGEIFDKDKFR